MSKTLARAFLESLPETITVLFKEMEKKEGETKGDFARALQNALQVTQLED